MDSLIVAAEEGVLGDPNPDWIGGLGTVLSWKGISLSAQFETSQGNDHWTGTAGVYGLLWCEYENC